MTEARKVNLAKDSFQRPQINSVKVSGGAGKPQAKHKNKIPKTLRYDLENALVGLCDVWFEEIKPYLERNNIKLHVHEADAGGGDPEASACSHLDPGRPDRYQHRSANCAGFCSTLPIASRARCPKPPPHPVSSLRRETSMERACPDSVKEKEMPCRRRRQTVSQSPTKPLVPRLCHTYSIPPRCTLVESLDPNDIGVLQKPVHHSISRRPSPKPKQFKDASTQTENNVSQKERVIKSRYKQARSQSPSIQKCQVKIIVPNNEYKKQTPLSPRFGKCHAKTSFFNPKIKNEEQALFQDDLIDIIREKHKKLEILYTNPEQTEYPSIMNLFSPKTDLITSKRANKAPHWK